MWQAHCASRDTQAMQNPEQRNQGKEEKPGKVHGLVLAPVGSYPSMVTPYGISIIGAGRVGRSLGRSLRERGWKIHAVVTQNQSTARRAVRAIGSGRAHVTITRDVFLAAVVLISVPDAAIDQVVAQLAAFGEEELRGRIILHTSGALSSEVLAPLRALGATVGSFHPLQSFSGIGSADLEGNLVALEGDVPAVRLSRSMARGLGAHPVILRSATKPLYHAAASISAGHVLALMEAAVNLLVSVGIKRREALLALLPLTRRVLENQERLGARAAWTGPLARGDYSVIAAHEAALSKCPDEYLVAYRALNQLAARVLSRDSERVLFTLKQIADQDASNSKAKGASA